MKKMILLGIVVLMLGWAVYDFVISSSDTANEDQTIVNQGSQDVGLEQGDIAPDLQLETIEGKTVKLSDYRGTPVILNFWATWCPPCRAEIPDFQELYDGDLDVEILAVNMTDTEDNLEAVGDFVEEYEMTFPVLMDEEGEATSHYEVQAYPTSYIITPEGQTEHIVMGPMNHEYMVQVIGEMQ